MMTNYPHSSLDKRRHFYTKEEQLALFMEAGKIYRFKKGGQNQSTKKFCITKEELEKFMWKKPISQIVKEYGVSSSTIIRKCHQWNISKPP